MRPIPRFLEIARSTRQTIPSTRQQHREAVPDETKAESDDVNYAMRFHWGGVRVCGANVRACMLVYVCATTTPARQIEWRVRACVRAYGLMCVCV